MKRREFLLTSTAGAVGTMMFPVSGLAKSMEKTDKLLNAYYFRAQMYTLVPRQVREDMQWMSDNGTDAVSVAILEQDLYAAKENVSIIKNEALKAGMKLFVVPSRWGGLLAGAPKVPSQFTIRNPQTWMKNKDGEYIDSVAGRMSSIFYPETKEFFYDTMEEMIRTWDIDGIVWDEVKNLRPDYSPKAIEKMGTNNPLTDYVKEVALFFSDVNKNALGLKEDLAISMFVYAHIEDKVMNALAENLSGLTYFGCDGRPWYASDGGQDEGRGKTLLDNGMRFLDVAHKHSMKSLWLAENHNMSMKDAELFDKRFPEVLNASPDQLIYYYYPRNLENPDLIMDIMAKHIRKFR